MFQLLDATARLPECLLDGSYNVYSAENISIAPGLCVPVKTKLCVVLPESCAASFRSSSLCCRSGVQTMNYSTLQMADAECPQPELILYLYNAGCAAASITRSDVIGNMCIVRCVKASESQTSGSEHEKSKYSPSLTCNTQSVRKMFISKYCDDPEHMQVKYFNTELEACLKKTQSSAKYRSLSKSKRFKYEARHVWKDTRMHPEIRSAIIRDLVNPNPPSHIDINAL